MKNRKLAYRLFPIVLIIVNVWKQWTWWRKLAWWGMLHAQCCHESLQNSAFLGLETWVLLLLMGSVFFWLLNASCSSLWAEGISLWAAYNQAAHLNQNSFNFIWIQFKLSHMLSLYSIRKVLGGKFSIRKTERVCNSYGYVMYTNLRTLLQRNNESGMIGLLLKSPGNSITNSEGPLIYLQQEENRFSYGVSSLEYLPWLTLARSNHECQSLKHPMQ